MVAGFRGPKQGLALWPWQFSVGIDDDIGRRVWWAMVLGLKLAGVSK
jgi:hypothetical protein